ncbi:hypothetical protein FRC03_005030 [Tulasnella sp. 419]|nr:hypothetical protein FRC03_005030 [Tulasnella sp. 419]
MTTTKKPDIAGVYRIQVHGEDLYLDLKDSSIVASKLQVDVQSQIWAITDAEGDLYKIKSVVKGYLKRLDNNDLIVQEEEEEVSTFWKVEAGEESSRISPSPNHDLAIDASDQTNVKVAVSDAGKTHQKWIFERLSVRPLDKIQNFSESFFRFTAEDASKSSKPYDIIVIGSGIGGGVLAGSLFELNSQLGYQAKSVLLVEKGDLVFHSHCLNTARPSGLDRGQQNDTFFALFKRDYKFKDTDLKDWKGGPMYCLGGRSAAWGLFSPRVHDSTLSSHFPEQVCDDLLGKWYTKAEELFKLSLPSTKLIHRHVMDRLNLCLPKENLNLQWQWGRIASEFQDPRNFDFAEGAYSTIDKLLEIAMSKPKTRDGWDLEHENFKILVKTEARKLTINNGVVEVSVKDTSRPTDPEVVIKGKKVVLAAGSVHSPAILLRSSLQSTRFKGRLTDHDILYWSAPFRYQTPSDREDVGSMKLQTYVTLEKDQIALANMSIDASSFLPRSQRPEDIPRFIMVFILQNPLHQENSIKLVENEPVVTMKRYQHLNRDGLIKKMQKVTYESVNALKDTLKVDFLEDSDPKSHCDIKFCCLELGGVAHELGTVPMPNSTRTNDYLVDESLKLCNHEEIYVCDLSVFPYSPESNPTLTLAGLSLRLSHELNKNALELPEAEGEVGAVNYTGKKIQVRLSNLNGTVDGDVSSHILGPGEFKSWPRRPPNGVPEVAESLFVYKLDQSTKDGEEKYLTEPELIVTYLKSVTRIY